ncbi:hypothetical protein C7S18_15395 [Ahniella affigens]|uniref:Bacterial Ig-like domain-containing protein n=1 Tax=Ahniella affigens TaxID=2021234 RepID=A0A2P1PUG9_9GAMM|nr:hypothetical protein [Ahniella affigens]AVP98484.1 hypothetical protein C7S18_15395 [Ahniella affigens]
MNHFSKGSWSLLATAIALAGGATECASAKQVESPQLVNCPSNLLKDASVRQKTLTRSELIESDGQTITVSRFRLDANTECALQTAPILRALSPDDRATRRATVTDSPMAALGADESESANKALCGFGTPVARVHTGRCGTGGSAIASAWFASSNLAIAGAELAGNYNDLCLHADGIFYDVHQVRRIGSGPGMVAGLSLMKAVGRTAGAQHVPGALVSPTGAAFGLSVEGVTANGGGSCHGGTANGDNGTFASFYWTSYTLFAPLWLYTGGPAFINSSGSVPVGTHAVYQINSALGTNYVNPVIKRFSAGDINTIATWANTAAPTQPVTITSPGFGATVNSNLPLTVSVSATGSTALELDGQPVGNPITGLSAGQHRLVAYAVGSPNFRHTIQFNAQPQAVADAHEIDDAPDQWKPLYDGQRKYHNFHRANDADWSAFAIGAGVQANIVLSGSAFGQCALNLYLHPNYPNGVRQLVASTNGSCANLSLQHASPLSPATHVYFLESKLVGNASSSNTDYNLLATTAPVPIAADAYEADNTRDQYKALYGGQPQAHNFHVAGDTDWTAFAVGPSVPVRVTMNGAAAERSRIRLYRQDNYPTGPISLIGTAEAASSLVLNDTFAPSGPYTVYYVETAAIWSGFYGAASTYQIAVDTF